MSKATEEALSALHAQLATVLKDALGVLDESGRPAAAILSVARQFLKDNHIESGVGAATGPLAGLAGLPVFDEDHNVVPLRKAG